MTLLSRDIYSIEDLLALGEIREEGENWSLDASPGEALNAMLSLPARSGVAPPPPRPELPAFNLFRSEPLAGNHFVSVDTGNWIVLSPEEHRQLRSGQVEPELASRLEREYILITEDNVEAYIRLLRHRYGFLDEGPTLHILVVTTECNLRCVYCQVGAAPGAGARMTPEVTDAAVDRVLESPASSVIIEFQGGEPLLVFDLVKRAILRAERGAAERGKRVEFSLVSNFTRIVTEERLRFLLEHGVGLACSLDGPPALHDLHRGAGYPHAWETLRRNVGLFRRLRDELAPSGPQLAGLLTMTRHSLPYVQEIVDTYLELGFEKLSIRTLSPLGRGGLADLACDTESFLAFWRDVVTAVLQSRRAGRPLNEFYLELLLKKLFGNETGYMDLRSPCGAGHGQIVYHVDGSVYPCDEARMLRETRFGLGRLQGASLSDLIGSRDASRVFEASVLEQYRCDVCAFKPFCGVCPILTYAETGSLVADVAVQPRCEVLRGQLTFILESLLHDSEMASMFEEILLEAEWQRCTPEG